jgi:hypothetical protein
LILFERAVEYHHKTSTRKQLYDAFAPIGKPLGGRRDKEHTLAHTHTQAHTSARTTETESDRDREREREGNQRERARNPRERERAYGGGLARKGACANNFTTPSLPMASH